MIQNVRGNAGQAHLAFANWYPVPIQVQGTSVQLPFTVLCYELRVTSIAHFSFYDSYDKNSLPKII